MPSRNLTIDYIRTIAILLVLIQHWFVVYQWQALPEWFVFFIGHLGRVGVILFLITSGYLITSLTRSRNKLTSLDKKDFYLRRFSRITPLLVLTITSAFLIFHLTQLTPQSNLLFNPSNFNPLLFPLFGNWLLIWIKLTDQSMGMFWGLLWTLACEIWFYLLFPICCRLAKSEKSIKLGCCFSIGLAFIFNFSTEALSYNNFLAFGYISVGVLLALEGFRLPNFKIPSYFGLPGKLCYGLYLWHPFTLFIVWNRLGFLGYFLITLLIALLSFHLFEKPIERVIRRRGKMEG